MHGGTTRGAQEAGMVFRWPRTYDWLLRLVWGKTERQYRDKVLELAGVGAGQAILDVGSGTGTQAIAACRRVGPEGRVAGVDASPEMVARARTKAAALGLDIDFREGAAQDLPFPDTSFDVVLSTTVIHCLPEQSRAQCFREMARVLKPAGRLLVVDFGGSPETKHSLFGHMRAHRRFELRDVVPQLVEAGLVAVDSGAVGFSDLQYLLARRCGPTD